MRRRLAPLLAVIVVASVSVAAASAASPPGVQRLPEPVRALLVRDGAWRPGCPVPLSGLRLLTVRHWGFDGKVHRGQLVVHADAAAPLARVFRRLHALRFPIRHLRLADQYGRPPADGDVSGAFRCRQSVPSPCTGGTRSGRWSNHAYGLALDLNPVENPYVGCGQTRDPARLKYADRRRLRKGMVTPAVVRAFRAIGWGWGGSWTGDTRDYMHFSVNGR